MTDVALDVDACRRQFPALNLDAEELPPIYFDGPAGSQTPQGVIDAISHYLITMNANHGGVFTTSRNSDSLLDEAHLAAAEFVGAHDPDEVAFGGNMTSLTMALSRALARTWQPGDEVIVTHLDHDANVSPWVLAARDAGAVVRQVAVRPGDCTLDRDDFRAKLTPRTRLVAVGAASNAVGTVNPVAEITRLAHEVGALVFIDAVHYAPHRRLKVTEWGCDFLACSAYKFFGPHVGVMWGRRNLLETLPAYKLRPAPDDLPGKWMTGTQNHECIAGVLAAIEYLADLGRGRRPEVLERREALDSAYELIMAHERRLTLDFLKGFAELKGYELHGIRDPQRVDERVGTFGFRHERWKASEVAEYLDTRGIYAWHGNFYALPLTEFLGLEPDGIVRVGMLHYNTSSEVARLIAALADLD